MHVCILFYFAFFFSHTTFVVLCARELFSNVHRVQTPLRLPIGVFIRHLKTHHGRILVSYLGRVCTL